MISCKACNKEFEPIEKEKFCSENCTILFNQTISKVNLRSKSIVKEQKAIPSFNFEMILRKKGTYTIENSQLEEIYDSNKSKTKFEMLLASQNLKVIKGISYSVIKKVV